jgi:ferredoxin
MEIVVDRGRCTGIGICESVDPDRFEVGADGSLVVLAVEVTDADLALAEEAVRSCPAAALKLRRLEAVA